jgi:hypothetical protein
MVPYDFLRLLPHLVLSGPSVQSSFKSAARHQRRQKCLQKTVATPHTCPNPASTRRGGKTNRHKHAQESQPLGTEVTPAIAKAIHREGPAIIQSHQPYIPKRDEKKNKHSQACVHRWWAARSGLGRQGHSSQAWGGQQRFTQAPLPAPPHASSWTSP